MNIILDKFIATPGKTKELLNKYNLRLSKSLGQNFLVDRNIIDIIINSADIENEDIVIEIGPGIGSLTQAILENDPDKFLAIEKDSRMTKVLKEIFEQEYIEIINKDVLDIDWQDFLSKRNLLDKKIKLLANLPYYITTPIIMGLLEAEVPIERYIFMVQKEVAERMAASPGGKEYGALSIAVQYYSLPEIVHIVPPSVFIPQPSVESAIICLKTNQEPPVQLKDEQFFFQIVKAIFQQRRKNIKNALSKAANIDLDRDLVVESLGDMGLDTRIRGEKLDIQQIGQLSNIIFDKI